jgi:hypothetical protein
MRAAYAEVVKPELSVSLPAWLVVVEILPRFARQDDIRRRIVACKVPSNLDAIALPQRRVSRCCSVILSH